MFVPISNTPRDYAWGSTSAMARLLGHRASGGPEAELWLGAHAGSPSMIVDPAQVGGARDLAEWIGADPATALGSRGRAVRLPFLLKILAADAPLSLQAHPSPQRAQRGFARENARGIPLDAAGRNYKDAFHKPELIYALSDTFDALCGFRDVADSVRIVEVLAERAALAQVPGEQLRVRARALEELRGKLDAASADPGRGLREVVAWLLTSGPGVDAVLDAVVAGAQSPPVPERAEGPGSVASARSATEGRTRGDAEFARELATVRSLAQVYPGDPGIVLSLLLNRVTLRSGQALYLPAGNIHAYLSGLGVELMAASDNVLRGGLTAKHIDVPELLDVLDFAAAPVPYLRPERPAAGLQVFRPEVPDFLLARVDVGNAEADGADPGDAEPGYSGGAEAGATGEQPGTSVDFAIAGPAIAICTDGGVDLHGDHGQARIARGEAVYVTPDESVLHFSRRGTVFLATTNG